MLAGEVDAARLLAETRPPEHLHAHEVRGRAPRRGARAGPAGHAAAAEHRLGEPRAPAPRLDRQPAAFAGFVALIGTGRLRVVAGDPRTRLDVVPCDEVAERIVEAAFVPPAPGALRIRHAVAGLDGALSLALCRERILASLPGRRRDSCTSGRRDARFHLAHALVPRAAGRSAPRSRSGFRRDPRLALALGRLRELQRAVNRDFAYFTHSTFDFRSSRPLEPPLDPARYLDTVCEGVERHLLRRERSR